MTRHPRPGSALAPIVTSAVYDIANPKSASRPLSMTDAMGNTTLYTYAPEHGGLLTETRPAPAPGAALAALPWIMARCSGISRTTAWR